jgi:hypothetical protein
MTHPEKFNVAIKRIHRNDRNENLLTLKRENRIMNALTL